MYNNTIGKRYDENLAIKDIAKMIKKEIKDRYPNIKISVKTEKSSVLDAIWIKLFLNEEQAKATKREDVPRKDMVKIIDQLKDNGISISSKDIEEYLKYSFFIKKDALVVRDEISKIVESYNYNKGADYFDRRFCHAEDIEII